MKTYENKTIGYPLQWKEKTEIRTEYQNLFLNIYAFRDFHYSLCIKQRLKRLKT